MSSAPLDADVTPEISSTEGMWAARIRVHLAATVEGIVATGRDLSQAKVELGHGRFEKMVTDHLGISASSARMFMAIARHPVIANREHVDVLPTSWGVLYQLSRLPEDQLHEAIEAGEVTPDLGRTDAKVIVTRRKNGGIPPSADPAPTQRSSPAEKLISSASGEEFEEAIEACRTAGDMSAEAVETAIRRVQNRAPASPVDIDPAGMATLESFVDTLQACQVSVCDDSHRPERFAHAPWAVEQLLEIIGDVLSNLSDYRDHLADMLVVHQEPPGPSSSRVVS